MVRFNNIIIGAIAQGDLILLDVMLPGLNGTEVLAGLRRKNDVPVIMVTPVPEQQLLPDGKV
jgi:DNA-binding response OmpR family regulator